MTSFRSSSISERVRPSKMASGWTDSSKSSPSSEWRFLDTRSMALARPSRTLISLRTLACWRWNSSSFFSSSTASMSASSLCMISRSSSFSMRSLSRCSRCIFTFSISFSRSSCRRFSAFNPSSFGSTPATSDFSIFLCHTKRSVRLASPKGFTLSVYPAISPCFSRAASFLAIFAARCARTSSLFSDSESEEDDEDEDGSRLDLFFFDLLFSFFSFFSFLLFFLEAMAPDPFAPLLAVSSSMVGWISKSLREHHRTKTTTHAGALGRFIRRFRPPISSYGCLILHRPRHG